MKTWSIILKILAALAVLAGIIFVIAAYGDKIVAWSKKLTRKVINTFRKAPIKLYEQDEAFEDGEVEAEETDFEG